MITRAKVQTLSTECRKLLFYSENLGIQDDEMLRKNNIKIRGALRKIAIANELLNRMIVCVTGLQGTGKSTLIKNFFDLDDGVLNIALGRGERLPVLITEKYGQRQIELLEVGIEKTETAYRDYRKKISVERFKEISGTNEAEAPTMYLEMVVPSENPSADGNFSYMLLPGYERKSDYWKTLIDFSVQCSDTAIFVVTPSAVSSQENETLMNKITEQFGQNVIFAITHSDESVNDNQEIKQTLMQLMKIGSCDEDRVVCTGAYADPEKNRDWKEKLKNAVNKYMANSRSADQKNSEYLEKIIGRELCPAVSQVEKMIHESIVMDKLESQEDDFLKEFDRAKGKMRKKYQGALKQYLKNAQREDNDKLVRIMEKFDPKLAASRTFFGPSIKDKRKIIEKVSKAMQNENGHYRYRDAFAQAVVECTDQICAWQEKPTEQLIDLSEENEKNGVIPYADAKRQEMLLADVTRILTPMPQRIEPIQCDTSDIMEAMAEIGTKYFGLVMVDQLSATGDISVPELGKSNMTIEDVKNAVQNTKVFAVSVLGVTGIDLMDDGVLNFVPKLAMAMGFKRELEAAAGDAVKKQVEDGIKAAAEKTVIATTTGMWVAGGLTVAMIAAGAVISFLRDYNRMQLEDCYSAQKAIKGIYDEVEKQYLELYDESMLRIRDRIESYLITLNGKNYRMRQRLNACGAVRNIQLILDEVRESLQEELYDITKSIQR